jgi:hypothetical protein
MRVLGVLRRMPAFDPCHHYRHAFDQEDSSTSWLYVSDERADSLADAFPKAASELWTASLPLAWCRAIYDLHTEAAVRRDGWNYESGWYGYAKTRRAAEDAAARAFARLPAERRAELLRGEGVTA